MGSRYVLTMLATILAVAAVVGCAPAGKAGYATITPHELQARLDAGQKPVIVDLREPDLYRAGHIPGAINIPFDQFEQRMSELKTQSDIVLACHTGGMGDASGSLLAERGYNTVSNVKGGMAAWRGGLEK